MPLEPSYVRAADTRLAQYPRYVTVAQTFIHPVRLSVVKKPRTTEVRH